MTTWHYAIARDRTDKGDDIFSVREVYFDDEGELTTWTAEPCEPFGETWMECANDLSLMSGAVGRMVLDLTVDPPALVHPDEVRE